MKYGCNKCGAELYEVHPPDDIYTTAKRFKEKDEEAFRIEVICTTCRHRNTFFWVKRQKR